MCITFVVLILLSGCPDKEESNGNKETEKVPNSMEKAAGELEQIITLLGGPLFDSRDRIEQMKNEQMQILANRISEKPKQSTTGSDKIEQNQTDAENEKQQDERENGRSEEPEEIGEESKEQQGDRSKSGKEEQKNKNESGEESKEDTESGENENSGEGQDAQRPSAPEKSERAFQYEDSLFGIPQWNEENWKMIKVLTDGMHFTWNNLQPKLLQKGISEVQTAGFGSSLEKLSRAVRNKSIENAQNAAFELHQSLAEYFSYYKTEIPPELQRISSLVTGIHFTVLQNNWGKAQELSSQLQQNFTRVKTSVEDNQTEIFKMLEISLVDLDTAVQKQDAVLAIIRTNLVAANIQELNQNLSQEQK